MAFDGSTYRLAFNEGGFNGNDNYDLIPPTAFVYPSRNIALHNMLREKRGGTSRVNATAIAGVSKCLGGGQFVPRGGVQSNLSAWNDGKVYKDQVTVMATGMSATNRFDFTQAGNSMFICDGATIPKVVTGIATATSIGTAAADWTGSAYPKFMRVHGRGASKRLFAFGVPGFEDSWYASASGSYESFVTGVLKFTGDFGDGYGCVAAEEANTGDLLLFGKRQTLIFQDSNSDTTTWGWYKAPWVGGAAHDKLVIKIENDIYAMMDDGEIYSVSTVAQTNDYKAASITRPASIHRYIAQNIDLTKIAEFHVEYEPNVKALIWWVVRSGSSTADTAIVHYLDRKIEDSWSIWDGTDNASSGMRATASWQVRKSDGSYAIYTGDSAGYVWEINKSTQSDNSLGYSQVVRTPWLNLDLPRNEKRFVSARVVFVVSGAYPVTFRWFVDDMLQTASSSTLGGTGSVFPYTFPVTFASSGLNEVDIPLGQVGKRIQFELENANAGQSVRLSQIHIDFVDRGPRPL